MSLRHRPGTILLLGQCELLFLHSDHLWWELRLIDGRSVSLEKWSTAPHIDGEDYGSCVKRDNDCVVFEPEVGR